ncbi:MSHA biogenesis protein MshK [Vibrio sp. UCD-FRSSP16_10]|uniref:MSHA biogenesis protein MshK n=1 Tax=unclassified Vibrio TaxID=2614977 RepID=UPI0007FE07F5|nr:MULTISPECIES: MSHA biogenesis protein MshK [unclassified Vibrio]OBT17448.1 MSHA biogenesis protein MshK [Vibrio sp. UCD-FRSSP16_30]OBT23217.1 MSHA biogenesis protein MshK [Vibrio sp. UCD-FRSSP16_10]
MVRILIIVLTLLIGQAAYAQQDPTAPLGWYNKKSSAVAKVKRYSLPTLQSIVCDDGTHCFAMLNDKILSSGQSVAGYKIKSITFERVTLVRAGKTWNLELFNSDVRQ